MKVLIGPSQFGALPLRRLAECGYEVIQNPFGRKLTRDELIGLLPGVNALVAGLESLDAEVLSGSELKVISRCGSGMANVDIETATRLGIKVFFTPNGPTTAVAEATLGALLILLRGFPESNQDLHSGKWQKRTGFQLQGKTAAIIGYGKIGREVGRLLVAFGVRVLAVDPYLSKATFSVEGVLQATLMDALPIADIFCMHTSSEATILGPSEFSQMKPGIFILNASRGGVIDEKALISAIDEKRVLGVWLDVFLEEPYRGPLTAYSQALLTPHIASYTYEGREIMEMETIDNLLKGFASA